MVKSLFKGTVAAVILFESSKWVTKKRTIRKMDHDNRIKALLDAVELAYGVKDEVIWEVHAYKCAGDLERTRVYLFDLGDVVLYHSGVDDKTP